MSRQRRSFFAYSSALLGLLSLLAVACFHFPELLTSKEFRAAYNEQFARHLLLVGLAAAFGIPGETITCKEQIAPALDRLLASESAYLLHVAISEEENVWPLVPPGVANHKMMEQRP